MLSNDLVIEKKEAKKYTLIPEDVYVAELLDITTFEWGKTDKDRNPIMKSDGTQEMESKFKFQFVLLDGNAKNEEGNDEELRGRNLFYSYVPDFLYVSAKGKNKLYQVIEGMIGEDITLEQEAGGITGTFLNELVGGQVRVVVSHSEPVVKNGVSTIYANIDNFLKVKSKETPLTTEEKENATIKPKEDTAEVAKEAKVVEKFDEISEEDKDTLETIL